MFGIDPGQLRRDLREADTPDLRRRRSIIGLSLIGLINMAAGVLVQTGILKKLPEIPSDQFDSDKVILSDEAYMFGSPDAAIAVMSLASNLPLAAFGGADRAEKEPLIPIAATLKSMADLTVTGWYFHNMRYKEKTWCPYCMLTSAVNLAVFALTIPETIEAVENLLHHKG